MLFNSPAFIFGFFPITLIMFFIAGRFVGPRVAQAWLILASLFFYGYWNPIYLPLIMCSMMANYGLGLLLSKTNRDGDQPRASLYLGLGVAANLALLGYFKYANFFVATSDSLFNTGWTLQNIVLPIGISFFTFQKIGYLVDARQGIRLDHGFLQYSLFVLFFPQLLAGPIVHHTELIPQFKNNEIYRPRLENLCIGLTIFIIGLFKKVVIADNLSTIASPVFAAADQGQTLHFYDAWQGTLAYTFQIYFDFSGYTDMAIGLSRCFGIKLPLNFHSPYQAVNIIDFWRRWHMTLSRFLRDYLYFSLGGNRRGPARRYANLLATMLLGGLWHGAGWNFIIWGALHGAYLVINHAWQAICPWKADNIWTRGAARLTTCFAVMMAWIFFRATTFEGAMAMFRGLVSFEIDQNRERGDVERFLVRRGMDFTGDIVSPDDIATALMFGLLLTIVWFFPNTQQIMARAKPAFDFSGNPRTDSMPVTSLSPVLTRKLTWDMRLTWAALIGILCFGCLSSLTRISEFLYFQF